MAINITDLPPRYQAQALKELEKQQKRRGLMPSAAAVQNGARGPKYHNSPTERVAEDGTVIKFDRQKEARRCDELIRRLRAALIRDLRLQVDFTLQEAYTDENGHRVRAIRYRADFTYRTPDTDALTVEDVKSRATRTREYLIKRKMMKDKLGITITEV